jgi:hypothetical protein
MDKNELLEAMKIYQRKHGGTLVEVSILFANVTSALREAAQQSVHLTGLRFPEHAMACAKNAGSEKCDCGVE